MGRHKLNIRKNFYRVSRNMSGLNKMFVSPLKETQSYTIMLKIASGNHNLSKGIPSFGFPNGIPREQRVMGFPDL